MKILTILSSLLLSCSLMAEGDGKHVNQGFLKTAKEYDAKAQRAANNNNAHNAEIYKKLAAIKREAAVSTNSYDWTEYHKLNGQLNNDNKKAKHNKGKKPMHKEKMKEKASTKAKMEKKTTQQTTPTNYITSAQKHAALANKSSTAKDNYSAQIHTRLAAILIDAAAKQSENRDIDWTEYKELKELLGK